MNENDRSLLYFGIEESISAKKNRWEKYTLPVYRCGRKGKTHDGRLQYYYVPVPENYIDRKSRYGWKAEKLLEHLQEAVENVCPDDFYLHPEVRRMLSSPKHVDLPPMSLMEAMLRERPRPENVDICLPSETRGGVSDTLIHLLSPFLPRINTITVVGGEEALFEELEEYFYEEYGIVVNRAKRPGKNSFCLNLWSGEGETVKFLDTMVKNSYNTKVN